MHHDSQATTNQVQNAGTAELAERDDFTDRDSLGGHINMRFLQLLRAGRPYLDSFEEFRASVVYNEEQIIEELTQVNFMVHKSWLSVDFTAISYQCDRALAAAFNYEARDDLERATNCA